MFFFSNIWFTGIFISTFTVMESTFQITINIAVIDIYMFETNMHITNTISFMFMKHQYYEAIQFIIV